MGKIIKFESECLRCGFCCLSYTCPVGMEVYRVEKLNLCPGLMFDGDWAICRAALDMISAGAPEKRVYEVMGFGHGCCISARAYKNGVKYDFAELPAKLKISIAQTTKSQK